MENDSTGIGRWPQSMKLMLMVIGDGEEREREKHGVGMDRMHKLIVM